jgi:hypothetical protein
VIGQKAKKALQKGQRLVPEFIEGFNG